MKTNNLEIVYSVNGRLQAALVESSLRQVGIPTILANSKNGAYLDICVASEHAFDARNMLNRSSSNREICVFPEML